MYPLLKIGHSLKAVGFKGELKLDFDSNFESLLPKLEIILFDIKGDKVPYWIESYRVKGGNMIVKFEGVENPEDNESLRSTSIFALEEQVVKFLDPVKDSITDSFLHYEILDQNGNRVGRIERIESYPQQDMAIVVIDGIEKLLPLASDWILEMNDQAQTISMNLPEGILDL